MNKVNDLYGKQVISQATGEKIAPVRDIVLSADARRIVALIVGEGGWNSEEHVIRWNAVQSVGDVVIATGDGQFPLASDDGEISDLRKQAHTITGKQIIGANGDRLGTVGDSYYGDDGEILGFDSKQGLFGGNTQFLSTRDVQAIGKDAVIATTNDLGGSLEDEAAPAAASESSAVTAVMPALNDPAAEGPVNERAVGEAPAGGYAEDRTTYREGTTYSEQ